MNAPAFQLNRVDYQSLDARQQETFNFQKVPGVLANYGFATIRLSGDWQDADLIANHISGQQFLKVRLKGRLTLDHAELRIGTLQAIIPQSGIPRSEFER